MSIPALIAQINAFHPNVRRLMLFTVLHNVSISIWYYACWSQFVFDALGKSNTGVGWVSGANGIAEILSALLAGWLSDKKVPHFTMLQISMCLGIAAVAALFLSIEVRGLAVLCVAQAIYGSFQGSMLTSVESVFATYVTKGNRSDIYSVKYALDMGSQITGGFVSIFLFVFVGNVWSTTVLKTVMSAGLLLHGSAAFFCLYAVRPTVISGVVVEDRDAAASSSSDVAGDRAPTVPPAGTSLASGEDEHEELSDDGHSDGSLNHATTVCCFGRIIQTRHLPYIVAIHDTIVVLGSGLTTMFFSLFMRQDYGATPIVITFLNLGSNLTSAGFVLLSGRLAKSWNNRIAAMLVFKVCGALALLVMALARNTAMASLWMMSCVYVFRYGCMNCSSGLTRALIMDIVPERQRGRWNAVESMQSAAWSGTSVAGGVLADKYGYGVSFFFTFIFHAVGCIELAAGLCTPDREKRTALLGNSVSGSDANPVVAQAAPVTDQPKDAVDQPMKKIPTAGQNPLA